MKMEYKIEGDVLKIKVSEELALDKDGDGVASIKGSLSLDLEADGSEIIDELMKSTTLLAQIKAKLGL